MGKGYQRTVIQGNLGKDPDIRVAKSGTAVAKFSVAVGGRVKRGQEWVDHTEWFRCVAFGSTADVVGKYLQKGSLVLIEGRHQTDTWADNDGTTRYSTEVLVDQLVMGPRGDRPADGPGQGVASDIPF